MEITANVNISDIDFDSEEIEELLSKWMIRDICMIDIGVL